MSTWELCDNDKLIWAVLWQVNGGQLPPHVVPYCAVAAVLAALLPVAAFFLGRASAKLQERPALTQAQVRSPSGCAVL